jgi:cardiolipin synthase
MTAGALRIGNTVGAAIANRRPLGPAEARVMAAAGLLAFGLAFVAALWPWAVAVPTALMALWAGLAMLLRAYRLHGHARAAERPRGADPPA